MKPQARLPAARDKLLFTPGPLTTSLSVKQAMLHDVGSWHFEFNNLVANVRTRLLQLAGLSRDAGWEVILLQGSGTFGIEAVFQTCVPPRGKVAVLANGAYGERIVQMLSHARIDHTVVRATEDSPLRASGLKDYLASDSAVTHVAVVHCETTTGILNPVDELGRVAKAADKTFIVDAMSSFGGMTIDFEKSGIDFLISSPNKCLESVPGFSIIFCKRPVLLSCEGWARSLSLDLLAQLKGFEKNGQFRFTPPTHTLLAFHQALDELEQEGGIPARNERYRQNHETLLSGMAQLGFQSYLDAAFQSPLITAFRYPSNSEFDFQSFYHLLSDAGFIIYPGKLTDMDTFRIGTIGRIFPQDLKQLLAAVASAIQLNCPAL